MLFMRSLHDTHAIAAIANPACQVRFDWQKDYQAEDFGVTDSLRRYAQP